MTDLIVAGGGPAGLATALHAARAGLSVQVREPRFDVDQPIDKACGEGLMPGTLAGLTALGVDPPGHPLLGIRYLPAAAGTRGATSDFRAGPGRGVRRTTLHRALAEAVLAEGVPIEARPVTEVHQDGDGVTVDGERARYVVAADGLHSPLRRSLGLDAAPRRDGGRRRGLRRHYRVRPWCSHVEVHWARDAEAYVTPVADDLVGVAVLTRRRGSFDDHLAAFPGLLARLADAVPDADGAVRGAGPLRQTARRRTAGRVLLVGDAAGYVDALTGEGIALALASAGAAVDAVAADDPLRYERAWPRLTRRYRWLTSGLLAATSVPPVRGVVVPAARALPAVFDRAVDALARP